MDLILPTSLHNPLNTCLNTEPCGPAAKSNLLASCSCPVLPHAFEGTMPITESAVSSHIKVGVTMGFGADRYDIQNRALPLIIHATLENVFL